MMDDKQQLHEIEEEKLEKNQNHSSEWLYFDPARLWDDQHYLYQQQQDNFTLFNSSPFDYYNYYYDHHHYLPPHFHFDPLTDFQWEFLDDSNNNGNVEHKKGVVGATTATRMMMIMNDTGGDQLCRIGRASSSSSSSSSSSMSKSAGGIGLKEIQKYFDVPIIKAAKELKIGLTVLKKRCRELNIMRWPHRKIKSLNSLIHNFKELGRSRKDIEMLEEHKRMLEKEPELHLTDRTKRLRQACFKLIYKKRRSPLPYCLPLPPPPSS